MSQENVEIVPSRLSRPTSAVTFRSMLGDADPDVITDRARSGSGHVSRAATGFLQAFVDWVEAFDEFRCGGRRVH